MKMYERVRYPDGQISVKLNKFALSINTIEERINSYEDLFFIKSIIDAYPTGFLKPKKLFIPCLFGQRSDRRFSKCQSFDLKLIADMINSCSFSEVTIFDPHSDVAAALIHNSVVQDSGEFVKECLYDIDRLHLQADNNKVVLVAPDAGAYKKVFNYAAEFGTPLVAAVKHRFTDGKLELQFIGDVAGKDCLIVDDLADGGGTFVVLGQKLRELGARNVYLYVSHGYFNKGFEELKKYIDRVYCTNSVKDIEDPYVTQFRII